MEVLFTIMSRRPHILAVPFPVQGHVKPLMKLSSKLADHGIKVTFVNTEFIHARVIAAMSEKEKAQIDISLASIPDGLENENDRKDHLKFTESIRRVMPGHLADLIETINHSNNDEPITCVIVDITLGWIAEVPERMGVEWVGFCPFAPACLVLFSNIPMLIQAGVIDSNGSATKDEQIILSEDIPPWNSNELTWSFPTNLEAEKINFEGFVAAKEAALRAKWILCNTSYELDPSACNLFPGIQPVGPFVTKDNIDNSTPCGSFWQEETSSLSWLDKQETGSVIYVSFGSIAVINQLQFDELALGLEQSGQPFLWVVRLGISKGSPVVYPEGFLERVASRCMIVEWAPQEKVLAHPAIACFLTHCGWNSTMEGLSFGVPFLCWPSFGDQFHNQNYICDVWKVGLRLNPDENGIRSRLEIFNQIESLLSDGNMKANALKLQDLVEKSLSKGGSSCENLEKFVNHLKH